MRYELQVDQKLLWNIVDTRTGETTFSGLPAGQACSLVLRLNNLALNRQPLALARN